MRYIAMFNPIAGRGRAEARAHAARRLLARDGHDVELLDSGPEGRRAELPDALEGADGLLVFGGDGTVRAAAGPASAADTPVYHYPLGTENLFAREFAMDRSMGRLRAAVREGRVCRVDLARCNGERFLLMCSVGPDAGVVNRLARVRSGSISHLSYAGHIAAELLRPTYARVRVEVDGEPVVDHRQGLLVVANSRQYALRIDPAAGASMTDGRLDVAFFPASTRIGLVSWMVRSRLRRSSGALRARGERVTISNGSSPIVCQIDGEAGADVLTGGASEAPSLELEVEAASLPVLLPPGVA